MKITVIGAGSTGLVYGSLLSEQCDTTILVRRQEQADKINSQGTTLVRPENMHNYSPFATADPSCISDSDFVISLTKCYDALSVSKTVAEHLTGQTSLVCLHNGLGTIDIYNQTIGQKNVIGGVTYLGANRTNDTTAKVGYRVRTVLGEQTGEITDRLNEIVQLFSQANIETQASDSLEQAIWDKFVLAVGQHALCAITGLSFKEMRLSDEVLQISQALLDEAQLVAQAFGIEFEDSLMQRVIANLELGADHYSSTYQDIKAKRKTEIDYLNGAISRLGVEHLIPTPVNDTIANLVRALSAN